MFTILKIVRAGRFRRCSTVPPHPHADKKGYISYPRVLMENKLGRLLAKDEVVYHDDGLAHRNNEDNLILTTQKEFRKIIYKFRTVKPRMDFICANPACAKKFQLATSAAKQRLRGNTSRKIYCSMQCYSPDRKKKSA